MKLTICVATMKKDMPLIEEWASMATVRPVVHFQYNTPERNFGVVGSYDKLYRQVSETTKEDILCYLHDDVECREEGWDQRILREFNDEAVAIVGMGGALIHGTPDLYKTPYRVNQLIRSDYRSNVTDAEVHGSRFAGSCDVVVLDGFALCIRRRFLDRINGWSQLIGNIDFLMYDAAICALARRFGYRIRMCGISCYHKGGGTSVSVGVRQDDYDRSHRWFAKEFSDVMPAHV